MTGSVQVVTSTGNSDPIISWAGFNITIRDSISKPTGTDAYVRFRPDGLLISAKNGVETGMYWYVNPLSGLQSSNMKVMATFVAGVTTYVYGAAFNAWQPLFNTDQVVGVLIPTPTPSPVAANVILRFTLLNGYTGLQIGNTIDVNYDVQRN